MKKGQGRKTIKTCGGKSSKLGNRTGPYMLYKDAKTINQTKNLGTYRSSICVPRYRYKRQKLRYVTWLRCHYHVLKTFIH
jgi:hypothetical protein